MKYDRPIVLIKFRDNGSNRLIPVILILFFGFHA